MSRHAFRAMGTDVELLLDAEGAEAQAALRAAEAELRRLEALLSRFLPDSELSRLNRLGELAPGPDLLAVAEAALAARELTAGRFDPTVHDAVVAAGYDRTFELVAARGAPTPAVAARCGGGVEVDAASGTIRLDPGVRLDLGGIAKGYAVDRALRILAQHAPALVDAGGDIALTGKPWPVGVETADGTITLELAEGALATSGRDRRRWRAPEGERHHLIDPATGLPSEGDLLRVTAVAGTAAEAEVLAKALFLAGDADRAAAEADELGVPAVLVTRAGHTALAGGLA
ncbi:MAG TPA: FAD:protein FMN transferase [Gaiellaceae bacterium]|nr:FAD:protein FMN transferase [Gaiellaceae bacterium]